MRRACWIALLCVCALVLPATAAQVTIERSLGSEGDDLFLHGPMSVNAAGDGTRYLLNSGECQVMHVDGEWELLNTFGRCGQGPGEFENPRGMVLFQEELWVFEMARITVFGLDGEYRRTLVPGLQYSAPAVLDGKLAAVMGVGDQSAAFLNEDGTVASTFGTSCPTDFFESFKTCRNQQILPHDEGLCLLLNPLSGRVFLVSQDGEVVWDRELVPTRDTSRISESDDGETVTMSVTFLTGLGGRDPQGRYWFTLASDDVDAPTTLRVTDGNLKSVAPDVVMPEGIAGFEVFFTPDGRLGLVSTGESVIHLCRVDFAP
jgi:hypothetical protein